MSLFACHVHNNLQTKNLHRFLDASHILVSAAVLRIAVTVKSSSAFQNRVIVTFQSSYTCHRGGNYVITNLQNTHLHHFLDASHILVSAKLCHHHVHTNLQNSNLHHFLDASHILVSAAVNGICAQCLFLPNSICLREFLIISLLSLCKSNVNLMLMQIKCLNHTVLKFDQKT